MLLVVVVVVRAHVKEKEFLPQVIKPPSQICRVNKKTPISPTTPLSLISKTHTHPGKPGKEGKNRKACCAPPKKQTRAKTTACPGNFFLYSRLRLSTHTQHVSPPVKMQDSAPIKKGEKSMKGFAPITTVAKKRKKRTRRRKKLLTKNKGICVMDIQRYVVVYVWCVVCKIHPSLVTS